jgi:hypothetical protein
MRRIKFWIVFLFSTVLLFQHNKAQNFYAQVSSKKVQVGTAFEYAVVIAVAANNYSPPNFKDFDIVSGPNQSNSVQYVNGVMSQQMIIAYNLVPKKEGKFTIGPSAIMSNGQRLETAPVTIEAVKSAAAAASGNSNSEQQVNSKVSGGDLFIRTGLSKSKCFLGEQITIIQKVYCRLQIIGFQKFAQPTYDGFYSQAQESVSKGQLAMENVDGVNYYTYELFRTVATANKVGKLELTPVEGDIVVRKQSSSKPKNVFEQFFGAAAFEDVPVNTKSRPMTIEVLPLPENGKPEGFSGAVGNFQANFQLSRNEIKANDAFNLKLSISGKGNLKLITAPVFTLPDGFERYEPKISDNANSKVFDYLVIPRSEGDYILEGLNFSFFNLDTKKYVTISSPQLKIKVLPPDPNSAGAQVYSAQSQVKETENDIRYIKKGDFVLLKSESEFFNSLKHLFLLVIPLVLLLAALILRRSHIKNNSNQVLVKERKAAKMAQKQLLRAQKLMQENNKEEFYTESLTALNNYLSHKLNIPVADLSRDKINSVLAQKQINAETLSTLISTLDMCEFAKYAPGAVSGDLATVYSNTVSLITNMEQQLNKKVG